MQRSRRVFIWAFCLALALQLAVGAQRGVTEASYAKTGYVGDAPQAPSPGTTRIGEVMPKADADTLAWVELHIAWNRALLPLIPVGVDQRGAAVCAVPAHGAQAGVSLAGYELVDQDGTVYVIPADFPPAPYDALVVIYFGQGVDDDDFAGDNLAVLYTGTQDVLEDDGDYLALFAGNRHDAQGLVDFVAWGVPPEAQARIAATAGLWQPEWYVSFARGFGDVSAADLLAPNESFGLYPGSRGRGPDAYAVYRPGQTSPGARNPAPSPDFYTPEDGARVEADSFSVSWTRVPGQVTYRVQLADDATFAVPIYDEATTQTYFKPAAPLPAGTYYWRVQSRGPAGLESPWSAPAEIGIFVFPDASAALSPGGIDRADIEVTLGIDPVRQNKDSQMLCLAGDAESAWDTSAACTAPPCADATKQIHGNGYCVRASIRMMAAHYGGDLSMDRISYHVLQEWEGNTRAGTHDDNPNNDLGHNRGMHYPSEESEGLSWALGITVTASAGKPDFSAVQDWIDADRPIIFRNPGHMMVIDGYREVGGEQYIHVLDPDQPPDCARWQTFSSQTINGYWPGPAAAPDVRSDEASLTTDTDGDGIVDFDEDNRFATSSDDADSDADGVLDKQDMRAYVFDATGAFSYRSADWDGDGARKEVDDDNDAGGALDGAEDANGNGIEDAGEGSNFDATDDYLTFPVYLDRVYTTDYLAVPQISFRPGEAVKLTLLARNNTDTSQIAVLDWQTSDSDGAAVEALSLRAWSANVPPGGEEWWLARGIDRGAKLGTYTVTGTVTHGTNAHTRSATFTVQGDPIAIGMIRSLTALGIADNVPTTITDTFAAADGRVYVWTAWEGAQGNHTACYSWRRPDGSTLFDFAYPFNAVEPLYYTWGYIETGAMFNDGQWTVRVYMDGNYLAEIPFTYTRGGQYSVGAGSGDVVDHAPQN